jgi:hypothetical protein
MRQGGLAPLASGAALRGRGRRSGLLRLKSSGPSFPSDEDKRFLLRSPNHRGLVDMLFIWFLHLFLGRTDGCGADTIQDLEPPATPSDAMASPLGCGPLPLDAEFGDVGRDMVSHVSTVANPLTGCHQVLFRGDFEVWLFLLCRNFYLQYAPVFNLPNSIDDISSSGREFPRIAGY